MGEQTFNIKGMEIKDEKIKLRIWCLQHPSVNLKLFDLYEWIASSEDEEEMKLRMICVETEHMHQFKSLDEALNWIKNGDMPEWISNKKENNRPNDIPDLWYLREGDFLPEPVSGIFNNRGPGKTGIKLLKEAGNLFPSKEEATIASEKIREFLCSINNPWCL